MSIESFKNILLGGLLMSLFSCAPTYTTKDLREEQKKANQNAVYIKENKQNIEATINKFSEVFKNYNQEEMKVEIEKLYSENAFLNDRIHSVVGSQNIKKYFLGTFDKIYKAQFLTKNVTYGEKQAIIQWVMEIQLKEKDESMRFLGLSILQFNNQGKILYHQDYWDYSELLSHIRGVKSIVNYAKSKS